MMGIADIESRSNIAPNACVAFLAKTYSIVIVVSAIFSLCFHPAQSQTVGNGTVFLPSASQKEAYGINYQQDENSFATRHYSRSNDTGIGGSFIGTTSPTSESSPAVIPYAVPGFSATQFHLPRLSAPLEQTIDSPALQSFSPALPPLPGRSALLSPSYSSTFSTTSSANSFSSSLFSAGGAEGASQIFQNSLDDMPSFSRHPSLFERVQQQNYGK